MPEHPDANTELDPLLARLVEETITPEELEKLESVLDGNPEAKRRYLHYLGLHAGLESSGAKNTSFRQFANPAPRWRRQDVVLSGLAAAAVVLLAWVALQVVE